MKIALYGGAFNPVHNEHIHLVQAALDALRPDKLIVIPTAVSPHKSGKISVSGKDRLEMCRAAFRGFKNVEVSDCEITQGGVSYSYLTCRRFKRLYPTAQLYFLLGADMLSTFPEWKYPQKILECATLAACAREGEQDFGEILARTEKKISANIAVIPYTGKKVSSTRVRVLAALGEDFSAFTPPSVCQYIKDNRLYLIPGLLKVKEFLTEERWLHSVRVAILCAENAARGGLTEEEAVTVSALHDVAKYFAEDSPYIKDCPLESGVPQPVVHQFTGAYVAETLFGLTDIRLLDAIRYHASGRENMTDAEALLYLSDMLEKGRNFKGVDELRAAFRQDLRYCLYLALRHQVKYLHSTGLPVYGLTEKAYRYLAKEYE